jgi:hypothetical protein
MKKAILIPINLRIDPSEDVTHSRGGFLKTKRLKES